MKNEKKVRVDIPETGDYLHGKVLYEDEDYITIIDPLYGECRMSKDGVIIREVDEEANSQLLKEMECQY